MSTILKALKKAEDSRAKETLQGKITIEETPETPERPRSAFKIIAAVLLPALLAAVYMNYGSLSDLLRRRAAPAPAAKPVPDPVMTPSPAAGAAEKAPPLSLTGIIWDRENPVAIVNGQPLSPGEELSGARVVKITFDSVIFRRKGREFTVTVHE